MPITISGDGTITGAFDVATAGTVAYFGMTTPPTGWVKANGAALSRTTYSALFAQIGTTFGTGDGSTTFNVPDLRSEFPRGWDDGRGIDTGRAFGSAQADAFQNHIHRLGPGEGTGTDGSAADGNIDPGTGSSGGTYETGGALELGGSGAPRAAAETRPRNVALLACIKF